MDQHEAKYQEYDKNGDLSNTGTRDVAKEQARQPGLDAERKKYLDNRSEVARGRQHDAYAQARERQRIRQMEASGKKAMVAAEERNQASPGSESQARGKTKSP